MSSIKKVLELLEESVNKTEKKLNEGSDYTEENFKLSKRLGQGDIPSLKSYLPKTCRTIKSATKKISTYVGKSFRVHGQSYSFDMNNPELFNKRFKLSFNIAQYWSSSDDINVTNLTMVVDGEVHVPCVYVATDVLLKELKEFAKSFKPIKESVNKKPIKESAIPKLIRNLIAKATAEVSVNLVASTQPFKKNIYTVSIMTRKGNYPNQNYVLSVAEKIQEMIPQQFLSYKVTTKQGENIIFVELSPEGMKNF